MTSRERVLTAFAHEEPDRVPAWCGASAEFWIKAKRTLGLEDETLRLRFGDDFRRIHARYTGPDFPLQEGATYRTIFGIQRQGMGYGQPMSHPLANATLKKIHDYPWPDPAWTDPSSVRAAARQYQGKYAILGGDWSPFWHDAIDLLGMENLYIQMYEEPERVDAVMNHLVEHYASSSQRIFDAAADAIDIFFLGNDFGGQTGPLLGEALFRRFILPHLRRLINLGHDYGLNVMLHCCGGFAPLIPAMIEAGLDALHAVQTSCHGMDLKTLKGCFGDKILFNGCIDSHRVLINGTPDFVRAETREVMKIMKPGGGFVAGASHDTILEETPVENVLAMFDAIREYGTYE
ncbi:MAG TPA: uroporphyrinogen decarboxylase family protein [Candidatus Hydrogenedentes bacterium]|nr:uroporphyrinogen decarboxylase family protein [Candidatus Hydrogenedentota bacterium]